MLREQVAEILKSKMALEKCDPNVMSYFTDYYWVSKWVSKDEIASLAQAIHNLYMAWLRAEVEKLEVIGDDEIMKAHEGEKCRDCGKSIAEAQLLDCQEKLLEELG